MAALTATIFLTLTDKLAAAAIALVGSSASGFGVGSADPTLANDWGYSRKMRDYQTLILTSMDVDIIDSLLKNSTQAAQRAGKAAMLYSLFFPQLVDLGALCAKSGLTGVYNIQQFADYYNTSTGGPYNALLAPEFAALYKIIYPSVPISSQSIYAPAIANMAQIVVGSSVVVNTSVDDTVYAGAAQLAGIVSGGTFSGAGTITVTGAARSATGTINAGRTFTATVSGNGTVYFTPTVAGDLLTAVTNITLPGSMTAGAVTIAGQIPAGRTAPPA